jgi:hypothetical protein
MSKGAVEKDVREIKGKVKGDEKEKGAKKGTMEGETEELLKGGEGVKEKTKRQ